MEVKRRNINKKLTNSDIQRIKKNAKERGIPELESLALALNQRFIEMGKNQEWLVDKTKIGKATISAYCNAESLPNGANLLKLAKALNTTPDYLLGFTKAPTTNMEVRAIHEATGLTPKAIETLLRTKNSKADPNYPEIISVLLENTMFEIALSSLHNAVFAINTVYTNGKKKNATSDANEWEDREEIDKKINALKAEANKIGATVLWHIDAIGHYAHNAQRYISDCIGEYVDMRIMLKEMEIEQAEEQTKK